MRTSSARTIGSAAPTPTVCAELVIDTFRCCFFDGAWCVATARAGNVIGGGDWSPFPVVHDIVRAFEAGKPVALRYPEAIRPWQHVLNPPSGVPDPGAGDGRRSERRASSG